MTETEIFHPFEITTETTNTAPENQSFHEVFSKATQETLNLLGNEGKKAFYRHLKKTYGLSSQQIPTSIETFTRALDQTFGQAARIIEIRIMQALHESVPDFEVAVFETLSFVDYVVSLRLFL
jgi:hypothetical protein